MLAAAVSPATLSLANRTADTHIFQQSIPFSGVLPHAHLQACAPEHLLSPAAQPVQVRVIDEDIFSIAHAQNADEGRAGVESRAETRFTFAYARLAFAQL